jgi:BASS family bile acid:Na+ symporter
VLPVLVKLFPAFQTLAGDGTLLVMTIYAVGALAIGHLAGGPDQGNRTVLALSTAARHPGVAILLATTNFAGERLATPAVLLLVIVSSIAAAPYLALTRRRHATPVPASAHP